MSSGTGNVLIDRLMNLEHAVFGASGPNVSKTVTLAGSADAIVKSGIFLVASTVQNNMSIPAPVAGGPGVGNDGEVTTIYNVTTDTSITHSVKAPSSLMHWNGSDVFQSNPALRQPFQKIALLGSVSFLAYGGQLIVVGGDGGWGPVYPPGQWAANMIIPGTPQAFPFSIVDSNSNLQQATAVTGGRTTGSSAPTWNTTLSGTTTDNNVTWTLIQKPWNGTW